MRGIGLTGRMDCGKFSASALFAEQGASIIDTDLIAREVVEPGQDALESIKTHFGDTILKRDGQLNRAMLREHIFHNPDEKKWLETLLHPLIRQTVEARIKATDTPYCVVVIPLLLEVGLDQYPFIDRICVVNADESTQIERSITRDGSSAELAQHNESQPG